MSKLQLDVNEIYQLRISHEKEEVTIIPIEGDPFTTDIINLSWIDGINRSFSPVYQLRRFLGWGGYTFEGGWLWTNSDPFVLDRVAKPDFDNGTVR